MVKVVLKVGDDISTDVIYPGRFMATVLPSETPQYAFADDTDFNKALNQKKIPPGSIIIAGSNFGCGSSREQAASTIKGHELTVIAKNFARIFLQNAVNVGLHLVICPDIQAEFGDEISVEKNQVVNATQKKNYSIIPLPPARQAIMDAGGLTPYVRKKLLERHGKSVYV
ncbi:3-isopropylmalate dehydratase small subunit [bacterium]|nr:3-isopropylmalate dehydratase small subunit [bacterium]